MPAPDPTWLDPHRPVGLAELARMSGFSLRELGALVEQGVLAPLPGEVGNGHQFHSAWAGPLTEAAQLRRERGFDLVVVGVLLEYLRRIADLEHQVRALQPHLAHPQSLPREGPTPWREPHA